LIDLRTTFTINSPIDIHEVVLRKNASGLNIQEDISVERKHSSTIKDGAVHRTQQTEIIRIKLKQTYISETSLAKHFSHALEPLRVLQQSLSDFE
jgi:hypothetical protein